MDPHVIQQRPEGSFNEDASKNQSGSADEEYAIAGRGLGGGVGGASVLKTEDSLYRLEALSERWQLYLAVIYSLTAVTSFILNALNVIVLSRSRRSELRKYLINLSMSDLLMSLLSIPFTYTEYMLGRWIFSAFLCPVVRFVVTLSVFVSVATMTVIGINRHMAIMYPLRTKKCSTFRRWSLRKTHVIAAIWLLGIAISLPEYLMFHLEPFSHNGTLYYDCRNSWPAEVQNYYTVLIYLCTFAIPLVLLTYLYTRIGLKLWRRQMPGNVDLNRDLTMQTKRVKVIKMLLVLVVLFAVFWLPLQTFSIVMFMYPDIRKDIEYQSVGYNIFVGTYFACHWLSMAHSCVNPLIYCIMNEQFRTDLRDLVCGWRPTATGSENCISSRAQPAHSFRRPQSGSPPLAGGSHSGKATITTTVTATTTSITATSTHRDSPVTGRTKSCDYCPTNKGGQQALSRSPESARKVESARFYLDRGNQVLDCIQEQSPMANSPPTTPTGSVIHSKELRHNQTMSSQMEPKASSNIAPMTSADQELGDDSDSSSDVGEISCCHKHRQANDIANV